MTYLKKDQYKTLGISLVIFILLVLFLWLKPKAGIDYWLYNARNIDSIHVVRYSDFSYLSISDRAEIAVISAEFKNCKPVEVKAINVSKEPFTLIGYSHQKESNFDFMDCFYDGHIILSNQVTYRNDTLWRLVNTYCQKIDSH